VKNIVSHWWKRLPETEITNIQDNRTISIGANTICTICGMYGYSYWHNQLEITIPRYDLSCDEYIIKNIIE
jgi:hypothetical protein